MHIAHSVAKKMIQWTTVIPLLYDLYTIYAIQELTMQLQFPI